MIQKSPTLAKLIKELQQVPYVASKNLYRVVHYVLKSDVTKIDILCKALLDAKQNIEPCALCFAWKERGQGCVQCDNPDRNKSLICVVETWYDMLSIEKTGGYKGLYHILGGALCPLEGIGPQELTIKELMQRVDRSVTEIILATNQTPEGEATAMFIANRLKQSSVSVTSLARGIPVGSSLEYMDRLTLYKALSERRTF